MPNADASVGTARLKTDSSSGPRFQAACTRENHTQYDARPVEV